MELDWAHNEEGEERRQCCGPWSDTRGKKEKRPTENSIAANGRKGEKRRRLENMERCTPCSCTLNTVEERRPSLVCPLAQRDLRDKIRHGNFANVLCAKIKIIFWG